MDEVIDYNDAKKESKKLLDKISKEFDDALTRGESDDVLNGIMFRYNGVQEFHYHNFPV